MSPLLDLARYRSSARRASRPLLEGKLSEVVGLMLEGVGCGASIGDLFEVRSKVGGPSIQAEVVGLRGDRALLMPLGDTQGLEIGSPLRPLGHAVSVGVGQGLIGRVVDGLGRPLDGRPIPSFRETRPLYGAPRNPLLARGIEEPFGTGINVIDGLLTMGRGQRIGIFAGGGVGKSTLLGMAVRNAQADVAVIGLIGERGREVEDFVNGTLGPEGLARSVVVAATSADPPLVRARGALYATTIAEYFRARGMSVLLVMDSLTRYAMALREIGLSAGEPPSTKGYTPGVFAALPKLVERAGNCSGPGSITAIYTVLVEGDELNEPIADATRAILDGHIVLSRELAERGHFPAVDVPKSLSRIMNQVASKEHTKLALRARELIALYREAQDLVSIGAYREGAQPRFDEALARMPRLESFLRQAVENPSNPASAYDALRRVWEIDLQSSRGSDQGSRSKGL